MREGYKKTEIGVIPLDWEVVKLGDIATFSKGKGIFKKDISETGVECIRYGELFTTYKEIIKTIKSKTNSINNMVYSRLNDTLMPTSDVTPRGLAIASALDKEGVILGGDILIIRSERILNSYLSYFIRSHKREIMKLVSGSTVYHIYAKDMKKLEIPLPLLTEQKKIVRILSTADEKIEAIALQIEKAEMVKKGLMQRLLNQKWDKVLLDEVAKRGTGHTPNKKISSYWNGGIKWVSLSDSSKMDNRYIYETDKEISLDGIENSSAVLHPKNTVVLVRDAGIGKSGILGQDMAVSQHFIAWRCSEKLDYIFLYYWLQIQKPYFELIAIGSTIKTIGMPFFKKLKIPLPPLKEQTKIANILTKADEKLEVLRAKKAKYEELKVGLMQKLLTGEVRV